MNIESLKAFVTSPTLVKELLVSLLTAEAREKVIASESPKAALLRGVPSVEETTTQPTMMVRRVYRKDGTYTVDVCTLAVERELGDVTVFERYMASVEADREERIKAKAKALYDKYAAESLTPNWPIHLPAVGEDLRATVRLLHGKGWLKHTPLRVLVWMELSEAIIHAATNGGKPVEKDEQGYIVSSKKEERWNRMLERQFVHANGDTRTDRPSEFDDDPDAASEYNGTPVLRALVPTTPTICRECAAVVRDGVVAIGLIENEETEAMTEVILDFDSEEKPIGFRFARRCDCSVEFLHGTAEKLWQSPKALKVLVAREQRAEAKKAEQVRSAFEARPTIGRKSSVPKEVRAMLKESMAEQDDSEQAAELRRLQRRAQEREADRQLEQRISRARKSA